MSEDKQPDLDKDLFGKSTKERLDQYRKEKLAAMKARQTRVTNWSQNDQLYSGQPSVTLLTRSNLHIPKVFEGVQTTASKLGSVPDIIYETKPEGDEIAIELMGALLKEDLAASEADLLNQTCKIEGGLYGRGIIKIVPTNEGATFELVDTMAFLINPTATSARSAIYGGQQFIFKTIGQIKDDKDKFKYDQDVIDALEDQKEAAETPAANSMEKSLRDLRLAYLGYANVTQLGTDMVELTEWYTTLTDKDGKSTKVVMTIANDIYVLRCITLKESGLRRLPFASFATFPRGIVFWTPSVADILRDPNLAMDVAVNQQIDNNTYRNFGMLFVDNASGLKQTSIVPRPLGVTGVTLGTNKSIKDSVWQFTPPEITSAQQTLLTLGQIADNAAGLSATALGKKGKETVSRQSAEMAMVEAKTNLMRQNFMAMWRDIAELYAECIQDNLTSPRKVKISNSVDLTIDTVTKGNFKEVEFRARVTPSELSQENKAIRQKAAIELYQLFKDDPIIQGQKKLRERVAKEFDMTPEEIGDLKIVDAPQKPQMGQGGQPQPGGSGIPANPDQPQLSANGQATAAAVPNAIR